MRWSLLVLLVACGSEPGGSGQLTLEQQRDACEDAAHVLVLRPYLEREAVCAQRCPPDVGPPADGCDHKAGEECSSAPRAVAANNDCAAARADCAPSCATAGFDDCRRLCSDSTTCTVEECMESYRERCVHECARGNGCGEGEQPGDQVVVCVVPSDD